MYAVIIHFSRRQVIHCATIDKAVGIFEAVRDDGNDGEGYGASDMRAECGHVYEGDKRVATIHYNGRVERLP